MGLALNGILPTSSDRLLKIYHIFETCFYLHLFAGIFYEANHVKLLGVITDYISI